jgi:GTP:adenosylcobinamide-phosphate guanylyltransferase
MFDAVVMAGGGKAEPLLEQEKVTNKAFIPLHGKPLLGYVLDGLSKAPSIDRIVVVGPERELSGLQQEGYSFEFVPEAGSMLDNAGAALKEVDQERLCLVVSGDIPLMNEQVLEGFLALCAPFEHDFYYPILTRESCQSRFPDTRRTYVRLQEGTYTGGNIALIRPSWFALNRHRLEMFIAYRKKPLKLLRILPLSFTLKFLFKRLSVADLEANLSKLLQLRARAVPCGFVEIGTDVDKISDLEVVRRALSE